MVMGPSTPARGSCEALLTALAEVTRVRSDRRARENDGVTVLEALRRACLDGARNDVLESVSCSDALIEEAWLFMVEARQTYPSRRRRIAECARACSGVCLEKDDANGCWQTRWSRIFQSSAGVRHALDELASDTRIELVVAALGDGSAAFSFLDEGWGGALAGTHSPSSAPSDEPVSESADATSVEWPSSPWISAVAGDHQADPWAAHERMPDGVPQETSGNPGAAQASVMEPEAGFDDAMVTPSAAESLVETQSGIRMTDDSTQSIDEVEDRTAAEMEENSALVGQHTNEQEVPQAESTGGADDTTTPAASNSEMSDTEELDTENVDNADPPADDEVDSDGEDLEQERFQGCFVSCWRQVPAILWFRRH